MGEIKEDFYGFVASTSFQLVFSKDVMLRRQGSSSKWMCFWSH